jgi:hypothetical protein
MSRREAEIRALQDVIKAYRQATGVSFDAAWRALWKMQIERHEEMAVIAKTSSVSLVILHLRSCVEAASLRAGLSEASLGVKPLELKTQRLVWRYVREGPSLADFSATTF